MVRRQCPAIPFEPASARISNRHFIARLEIAVTSRKQTPAHRSNRNISDPPAPSAAFSLKRFCRFALTSNRSTPEFKKNGQSHENQAHDIL
jgi:hypothetical protein